MNRWVGKVAFVTGASSGIGAAIAEELVKAGVVVVGLARRLDKLQKLSSSLKGAKGKFYARKCDVTKEEDILNAFKWVNAELGGVDILVNNAGLAKITKITDDDTESLRNMLEVNVLAIAIFIQEAVASMKKRDVPGYIININSVFGHQKSNGGMFSSMYLPTKWAVTVMTDTIRQELATDPKNKIKITSISPGLVKSEFGNVAGWSEAFYTQAPYLDPTDVSDAILHVLGTRDKVQITEMTIRPLGDVL